MDTRIHDREELGKARNNAKDARSRAHYDRLLNKVRNESTRVESMRQNLVKAVGAGDQRAINYFTNKIKNER